MNDTIDKHKQELHDRIEDLEGSLSELKDKLKEAENEQHDAIDDLEIYIDAVDHKYGNLHDFWPIIVDEFRDLLDSLKSNHK